MLLLNQRPSVLTSARETTLRTTREYCKTSANAVVTAKALSDFDLFGETDADADAIAKSSAWGIKAGNAENQVFNYHLIQVTAVADATSTAQGSKVGSKDDTSAVTQDSAAGSKKIVDASLKGRDAQYLVGKWVRFLTGENEDFFTRIVGFDPDTGTITISDELPGALKVAVLDSHGNIITPADAYTFSAARNGASASVASAMAIGIDAGDGNATVVNTGVITVTASAKANTTAMTSTGQAMAEANASSEAMGIRTGRANDMIRNTGVINVESAAVATTSGVSATEIASATGIAAGDGNNTITNEGQINVTASVNHSNGQAEARGIITGSGDDVVSNYGTIRTTQTKNGVSTPGIAISTGAGNDTVTLGEGSTTIGAINLGDGDDTLKFLGTATVDGAIDPGTGSNTLVFDGAGTLDYSFSGFENTVKQGAGIFTLAGLPTMKSLIISEGTLQINSHYAMAGDSAFQTYINGDGS